MTPRERNLESLLFGRPDKVTFSPGGARESTLAAWHKQGLPAGINNCYCHIHELLGITPPRGSDCERTCL